MGLIYVLAGILISLGAFFLLVGSVGLLRLPDFFSRTHATGKADTLGIILIISGLLIVELSQGFLINSAKLLIIIAFVGLTNPTATNALAKAAFHFRMIPWFKKDNADALPKKEKD
jgi:multicomponent Na+:H+ antiporter subunit G